MGKKTLPNETEDTKNPALSLLTLFLPYITDFLFAALVFIVVLLATWALHSLGDALGLVKSLFFWRLFELLVLSFGTLWCVVFVIVEFAKKIKYQIHKPTKEVDDKLFRLHPLDITRRFGEPLRENRVSLVVCSFIVVAFLYVGISFADLVQNNCDDLSILACELLCETGPDFQKPIDSDDLEKILGSYAKYMKNKHLAVLLKVFPNYSPMEVLADVNETLGSAKGSQEKVANDIWRAGEEIMLFRLKAPKLLPRGIAFHEYRKATKLLLPLAAAALVDSNEASEQFNNTPTMENAIHSCERNRITMLLLFPLRASYDRPEVAPLFTSFRAVVEDCRYSKIKVANIIEDDDDPRKEFLTMIAQSEQRRLDILDDIKNRNVQEAIERMWDSIEIACSTRSELLELCAKIRSARNYSKEIRDSSSISHPRRVQ